MNSGGSGFVALKKKGDARMYNFAVNVVSVTAAQRKGFYPNNSILPDSNIISVPPLHLSMHAHTFYNLSYSAEKNLIRITPPSWPHLTTNKIASNGSYVSIKFYVSDKALADRIGDNMLTLTCDSSLKKYVENIISFIVPAFNRLHLNDLVYNLLLSILSRKELEHHHRPAELLNTDFFYLVQYLYKNHTVEMSCSDMAKFMYLEKNHFSKKFKAAFGITPMRYLYSLRLNISLEHLSYSNTPVSGVAEKVCFRSCGAFCSAFRCSFDMTPTEYRRLAQTEEKQFHNRLRKN